MQKNEIQENAYREVKNGENKTPGKVPERYMSRLKENIACFALGAYKGLLGAFSPFIPPYITSSKWFKSPFKRLKERKDEIYGLEIDENFIKRTLKKTIGWGFATYFALFAYNNYNLDKHASLPYITIPTKTEELTLRCSKGVGETGYGIVNTLNFFSPLLGYATLNYFSHHYETCVVKTKDGIEIELYVPKGSADEEIKEIASGYLAEKEAEIRMKEKKSRFERKMEQERKNFEERMSKMKEDLIEELEQKYREML